MTPPTIRRRQSRVAQLLSTTLFIVAIGFAVAAIYIWYTDDSSPGPGTPPPAESAEEVDLAQVLRVLDASDDGWDYGRNPASVRSDQISMPGQHLVLGDAHLYVFIFTGPTAEARIAAREDASASIDLETMTLKTPSGTVVSEPGAQLYMAEHSNVIAILAGGDQALHEQVSEALAALP